MTNRCLRSALLALTLVNAVAAQAAVDPVQVSYTVSGTSGSYVIDFTLTNASGHDALGLDFFGIEPWGPADAPGGFYINEGVWNPYQFQGVGPDLYYSTSWFTFGTGVANGSSLSEFKFYSSELTVPATINWFAYGTDDTGTYDGHGSFSSEENKAWNPGFAGTASLQAVPEPGTFVALGLGGLVVLRRRRK